MLLKEKLKKHKYTHVYCLREFINKKKEKKREILQSFLPETKKYNYYILLNLKDKA